MFCFGTNGMPFSDDFTVRLGYGRFFFGLFASFCRLSAVRSLILSRIDGGRFL